MQLDTTEQSVQVGRFLAIVRKMEVELVKVKTDYEPSLVEENLHKFVDSPARSLDLCQIELIQAQKQISEIGKPDLIEDIRDVFAMIDIPYLFDKMLDEQKFMFGYASQLSSYD